MTDSTRSGRPAEVGMGSRKAWRLLNRRRRILIVLVALFVFIVAAIAGHLSGREMAHLNMLDREQTIQQLRSERQELGAELSDRNARISALQARLTKVQTALEAILPSENMYIISPNQSLLVAGGRLTVGLIGSPSNQGVNLNINGKQRPLAAGDVVNVAVDSSTNCEIAIQSFDMFKAVFTALCAPKSP